VRGLLPGAFRENDRIRAEGAGNLAAAAVAAGAARFIQESFAPVYEDGGARWLDEQTRMRPAPYNRTVLAAERAADRMRQGGGTAVVLRFAYFYGADSRFLRDSLSMLRRGSAPLPGDPGAYVSSVSHDDAARAVVAALTLPSGAYNVCDDEPLTRADFFAAMADAFGLRRPKPMPRWMARLMGPTGELLGRSLRISNAKLRAHGWAPRDASVRTGLPAVAAAIAAAAREATRTASAA
jgi:nucleoside-diphosphate-sugar epimerase